MLRFALTSRYVRPEKMPDDIERKFAEEKGKLPAICDQYTYDGDINAQPVMAASVSKFDQLKNNILAEFRVGDLDKNEFKKWVGGLWMNEMISAIDMSMVL